MGRIGVGERREEDLWKGKGFGEREEGLAVGGNCLGRAHTKA